MLAFQAVAFIAYSGLAPELKPLPVPRLSDRNHGLFLDRAHAQIRIPAHDRISQIAHGLSARHVNGRDARRAQAVRDYNVRHPAARTQAERRSHQAGGRQNLESH